MNHSLRLTGIILLLAVTNLSAATLYVSLESTNPTPPYTNWATAATNIQQTVEAAAASDEVVVTNGVYPGGVTVTNPLTSTMRHSADGSPTRCACWSNTPKPCGWSARAASST